MKLRKILIICLLALVACNSDKTERASKPAFKGMELYSWKPAGGNWYFSLLHGTNRQKDVSEITKPEVTILGIDNLKQRLAKLAEGESVSWSNMANEPVPPEVIDDLDHFCRGLGIKLEKP
jgi:hypothetical protein